ncbi:Uncharacterised protein [Kluyvera cryocrescens]|uniref:Uncharacterized protein n=1 Tax=Kluyvera cryocrescens TaxID=580 RepID=A0A485A8H4_KLUCR|nr:Uncharacterised protein [Kluyvera cryocrescens]
MAGLSWVLSAHINGLMALYLVYGCIGGLGTGIVYIGVVGADGEMVPAKPRFCRRRRGGRVRNGGRF